MSSDTKTCFGAYIVIYIYIPIKGNKEKRIATKMRACVFNIGTRARIKSSWNDG